MEIVIKYVFYLYLIWSSKSTTILKCLWNRPGVRLAKCEGSKWFSTTSTVSTTITTTTHHTWCHIYHIHYTYTFTYFSECYQSTRSIYPSLRWGIVKQGLVAVMSLIVVKTIMFCLRPLRSWLWKQISFSLHSQAYLCHESSQIPIMSPAGLLSLYRGEGKQQTAKDIKTLSPWEEPEGELFQQCLQLCKNAHSRKGNAEAHEEACSVLTGFQVETPRLISAIYLLTVRSDDAVYLIWSSIWSLAKGNAVFHMGTPDDQSNCARCLYDPGSDNATFDILFAHSIGLLQSPLWVFRVPDLMRFCNLFVTSISYLLFILLFCSFIQNQNMALICRMCRTVAHTD